jgi:hypothetical protein
VGLGRGGVRSLGCLGWVLATASGSESQLLVGRQREKRRSEFSKDHVRSDKRLQSKLKAT